MIETSSSQKMIMNTPNITTIDRVLQFILATAGQEDDFRDRELGPIHLIKYLYLADLTYAEKNNGETYTSLQWRFYHFGPWSKDAYLRIEPALQKIGAIQKEIPSQYEGDFVRWSIQDDQLYRQLVEELPFIITNTIQKYVHQFNRITEDLLHFVYNTWPMLRAKPGELLDFSLPTHIQAERTYHIENSEMMFKEQSGRQKKKRERAIVQLKKRFQERLEAKKKKRKIKPHPPRYDDVFYEGLEILDLLAGEEIPIIREGTVRFSDDIWKSKARFDPDVS